MENQKKYQENHQILNTFNEYAYRRYQNNQILHTNDYNNQNYKNKSPYSKLVLTSNTIKKNNQSSNKINGSIYQSRLKNSKVDPGLFVISYNFDAEDDDDIQNRTQNLLIGAEITSTANLGNKLYSITGKQNKRQIRDNSFACSIFTNNSKSYNKNKSQQNGHNSHIYNQNLSCKYLQQQHINYIKQNQQYHKRQLIMKTNNNQYGFLRPTQSSNYKINPYQHNNNLSNNIKVNTHFNGYQNSYQNQYPCNYKNNSHDLYQVPQFSKKRRLINQNYNSLNRLNNSHSMNKVSRSNHQQRFSNNFNKDIPHKSHHQINNLIKKKGYRNRKSQYYNVNNIGSDAFSLKDQNFNQNCSNNHEFNMNQKLQHKKNNIKNNCILDGNIDQNKRPRATTSKNNSLSKNKNNTKRSQFNQNFQFIPKTNEKEISQNNQYNYNKSYNNNRKVLKKNRNPKNLTHNYNNEGSNFDFDKLKLKKNAYHSYPIEKQIYYSNHQKQQNNVNLEQGNNQKTLRKSQNQDLYTKQFMKSNMINSVSNTCQINGKNQKRFNGSSFHQNKVSSFYDNKNQLNNNIQNIMKSTKSKNNKQQQKNDNFQSYSRDNEYQALQINDYNRKKHIKTSDGLKNKRNKQMFQEKISNTQGQEDYYSKNDQFFQGNFIDSEDQLSQTLDNKQIMKYKNKNQQHSKISNQKKIKNENDQNNNQKNNYKISGKKGYQNEINFQSRELTPLTNQHQINRSKKLSPYQQKNRQLDWNNRFHVKQPKQNFIDPQKQVKIDKKIRQQRLIYSPYQSSKDNSIHSHKKIKNSNQKSKSSLNKQKNQRKQNNFTNQFRNSDKAQTDSSLQYQKQQRQSSLQDENSTRQLSKNQKDHQKRFKILTKKQSCEEKKKLMTINSVNSFDKGQRQDDNINFQSYDIPNKKNREQHQKNSIKFSQKKNRGSISSKKKNLSEVLNKRKIQKSPLSSNKQSALKKFANKDIRKQKQDPLKNIEDKYNSSGENTIGQDEAFWQNLKKIEQKQVEQQRLVRQRKQQKINQQQNNKIQNKQKKYNVMNDDQQDNILSDYSQQSKKKIQTQKDKNKKDYRQQILPQLQRQNSNRSSMRNSETNFRSSILNKSDSNRFSKFNPSQQKRISFNSQQKEQLKSTQKQQIRDNNNRNSKSSFRNAQNTNRLSKKIQLNPIQNQRPQHNQDLISNSLRQNGLYQKNNQLMSIQIDKSLKNYKRAPIISFLYNLPNKYQSQIDKYDPGKESVFLQLSNDEIPQYSPKNSLLKQAMAILCSIDPWIIQRIIQPINKNKNQIGVWLFYKKTWKCFIFPYEKNKYERTQSVLQKAVQKLKGQQNIQQLSLQKIIRIISGLKVLQLKSSKRAYKQVQLNIKRNNIIKAMITDFNNHQNIKQKDLRFCDVIKVQSTTNGSNVIQIRLKKNNDESLQNELIKNSRISQTFNHQNWTNTQRQYDKQLNHNVIWVKQSKFLQIFKYFLLICNRQVSYWTYFPIQKKQNCKSVYQINANIQTYGSISLHYNSNKKASLILYKQIEPKVLKFVGKVHQKNHGQNLNFDFTIKGSYYLFIECQDSLQQCLLSYQGSSEVNFEFSQFVKSQNLKNEDCQYVQMMKTKKNGFQKFNQIKQKFIDFLMRK